MAAFIEGVGPQQAMLLRDCMDDCVVETNPARVADAVVDRLEAAALGSGTMPEATGRPGYHPGLRLRIDVYGDRNRIQSSRRPKRECGRNLDLVWLTGRLQPDAKTIADFGKEFEG